MTGIEIIRELKESTDSKIMDIFKNSEKNVKYGTVQMAINYDRFEDLSVGNLVSFAEALGYRVVVAPKGLIETEWRVTRDAD